MEELKQRFPDDLAYDVFFDTTVFVTSTIEEVVRTLVIAFVLVAIVVFLFLGKLRTTAHSRWSPCRCRSSAPSPSCC